jgi:HD-like signal output (HDOD) protein
MKPRNSLTATEVSDLHLELERRLGDHGIESQPGVAARILELTRDPEAGMSDYARILRNDAALSGRLIRLANSAFFAQRQPVTSVDRACVLLGLDRLRSLALGFHLARAAASDADHRISREVWSQSVYRACLCAEIIRAHTPRLASEAFVIGLMLDAGVPLAYRFQGAPIESIYTRGHPPLKSFGIEFAELPYTHVDVVTALARRWKFPDLLAKPIEWHHTPPGPGRPQGPVHTLHRAAYYVGALLLRADGRPAQRVPTALTAQACLDIDAGRLSEIVDRTAAEYSAVLELFTGVADTLDAASLAAAAHQQLADVLEGQMAAELADSTRPRPQQFRLGGLIVSLLPEPDGLGTAYTYDSSGDPLSTYRFLFATETVESLREALGLDADPRDDVDAIGEYLSKLAA